MKFPGWTWTRALLLDFVAMAVLTIIFAVIGVMLAAFID